MQVGLISHQPLGKFRSYGRCCGKIGGEDGRISSLEIRAKTRDRRILIKEGRSQIQLITLIETMGKLREGNRIKAVLWEGSLGIHLLKRHVEQVGNYMRKRLA